MKLRILILVLLAAIVALRATSESIAKVNISTVRVTNPGNAPDNVGLGGVDFIYHIGKFEVMNSQYVEFLNGVDPTGENSFELFDEEMMTDSHGGIEFNNILPLGSKYQIKTGRDNHPVNFVSWYDAIRFANWLDNGQGSGDTETGAYTLIGGTPTPINAGSIARNSGALWFLPSENEWYKAAYHKNDGATASYWDYPTQSDVAPVAEAPPGSNTDKGSANYDLAVADTTEVGAYVTKPSQSAYGTFDQGGNVSEWNEENFGSGFGTFLRGLQGGSWTNSDISTIEALGSALANSVLNNSNWGFRVATTIPEPTSSVLAMGFLCGMTLAARQWVARATLHSANLRRMSETDAGA